MPKWLQLLDHGLVVELRLRKLQSILQFGCVPNKDVLTFSMHQNFNVSKVNKSYRTILLGLVR